MAVPTQCSRFASAPTFRSTTGPYLATTQRTRAFSTSTTMGAKRSKREERLDYSFANARTFRKEAAHVPMESTKSIRNRLQNSGRHRPGPEGIVWNRFERNRSGVVGVDSRI